MLRYFLAIAIFVACTGTAVAQAAPPFEVKEFTLNSKSLNEERAYSVYLHHRCVEGGKDAPCPIIYVLDGNTHAYYLSGILDHMSKWGDIPRLILVAIPAGPNRMRDYSPTNSLLNQEGKTTPEFASSGGGDAFLDFVEKELIPVVESRYNPLPYRILVGHSLGGLLTLHSFVSRPNLFQAHIAIDPSLQWDNRQALFRGEAYLARAADIRNKVYISVAEHAPKGEQGDTEMEVNAERYFWALQANGSPHLKSALRQFAGEDHNSVPLLSFYHGLKFVFDGYKNTPPAIASRGPEAVEAYYHEYLEPYGIHVRPPVMVLLGLAMRAGENGQTDEQLIYLKKYLASGSNPANAHGFLGDFYRAKGQKDLAIWHYEKLLELEPEAKPMVAPVLEALRKPE